MEPAEAICEREQPVSSQCVISELVEALQFVLYVG